MSRKVATVAEIGGVVRLESKALGLSQDVLAGAASVGQRFVVDLEAGKPTLRFNKVLAVLDALGLTLDFHGDSG